MSLYGTKLDQLYRFIAGKIILSRILCRFNKGIHKFGPILLLHRCRKFSFCFFLSLHLWQKFWPTKLYHFIRFFSQKLCIRIALNDFGQRLWPATLAGDFGRRLWPRTLARDFGPWLWPATLARDFCLRLYHQRWAKGPIDRSSDTNSILFLGLKLRLLYLAIVSVRFKFQLSNQPVLFPIFVLCDCVGQF